MLKFFQIAWLVLLGSIYKTFHIIKMDSGIIVLALVPAINCLNFCLMPVLHELPHEGLRDFDDF